VLRDQMSSVVFPLPFDELRATVEFRQLNGRPRSGDGYELTTFEVSAPREAPWGIASPSRGKRRFVRVHLG
jgi:hypothetical protein